jgi:hypothetical protein
MKTSVLVLLVAALASTACNKNSQSVTAPATSTSSGSTETFSGSLALQGSSFYSFTVTTAETVSVSLATLTPNSLGPASTSVVRLGLGVPSGTGCSVNTSVDTAAGLTAQLTAPANPDVHCVSISDIGNLTDPMNFMIRIGHNVTSPSSTTTTIETFASFLAVGGSSARTFSITQSGTISLTLTSVTPSITIGLGIGIPSQGGCSLSRSVDATAGSSPQVTVAVDASTYCAEVYDAGTLTVPAVAFSMTIAHP